MITKKALIKTKAVLFSKKFGTEATQCQKKNLLYNWKKAYIQGGKIPKREEDMEPPHPPKDQKVEEKA